ncbi:MAG: TIGR04282 family arsenosugar biosynthesis glycosyltransferase [Planctomycetota bacterium]
MRHLGLFAKFWEAGKVKTRLAATIGPIPARDIYLRFLHHLIHRFDSSADCRDLVYTPAIRHAEFASIAGERWSLVPQVSGGLGVRMRSFFETAFSDSPPKTHGHSSSIAHRVVIIGADSPQLDPALIEHAFVELLTNDAVIGPSCDGGYYLIGFRDRCLNVFENIEWSTPTVFAETEKQLQQLNINYATLPSQMDIDDWPALAGSLKQFAASTDPDLQRLEQEIQLILGSSDALGRSIS